MATMGKYCKAYPVERFEGFAAWRPQPLDPTGAEDDNEAAAGYFFLQEDYTVTDGIFLDERIVFSDVTPEWITYCKQTLAFEPPADEPEAAPVIS